MFKETEFKIENLRGPLVDVDFTSSGSLVGVTGFTDDEQKIYFGEKQIELPEKIISPIIRSIDDETVLVSDLRMRVLRYEFEELEPGKSRVKNTTFLNEKNAWIINSKGEITANFSAGDAIENIVITKDFIVVTYFDEAACYGEGLEIYDFEGKLLFGYGETFGKEAVEIYDCYAAALVEGNQIIFCPYDKFPLVLFDIEAKTQKTWETPAAVRGFHAITKFEDKVYFHLNYKLELEGYDFGIYEWQIGSEEIKKIGEYQNYFVRGLSNGRFLAKGDSGYTIISLQ